MTALGQGEPAPCLVSLIGAADGLSNVLIISDNGSCAFCDEANHKPNGILEMMALAQARRLRACGHGRCVRRHRARARHFDHHYL